MEGKGDAHVSGSLKLPLTNGEAVCVHEEIAKRIPNVRFIKKENGVHSASAECFLI